MNKRTPKKNKPHEINEEDQNQNFTYDDEDEHSKIGLREADISKLPKHIFENLKQIKCSAGDGEALTSEELESTINGGGEVWIIQCPKNVNPSAVFSGKKISLDEDDVSILNTLSDQEDLADIDRFISKSKNVKKCKATYEALSIPSSGNAESLITVVPDSEGNRRIVATSLTGRIIVRESLEDIPVTELTHRPLGKKQPPPGLKQHHPIYGVDYSHPKVVGLKTETDNDYYAHKSQKRKRKKSKSVDESYSLQNSSYSRLNKLSEGEKLCNGSSSYNEQGADEFTESTKKKKKKKKKNEDEYVEQEVIADPPEYDSTIANNIKEEVFSPKKKKRKSSEGKYKAQDSIVDPPEYDSSTANNTNEEQFSPKKKKSKKRKREEEEVYVEPIEEVSPPKTKKHKKNKSKHKDSEEVY